MLKLSNESILNIFKKASIGLIVFITLIIFGIQFGSGTNMVDALTRAIFISAITDLSMSIALWIAYVGLEFYFNNFKK